MKWGLLISVILSFCNIVDGQVWNGSGSSSRISVFVPDSVSRSAPALASYIRNRYDTPPLQLRALYSWVTANIRYDKDSSYYLNRAVDHETQIAALLRRRKGVCEGYAALFADLASRVGLRSYVIYGYPVGVNTGGMTGHAWCAVELNNDWWMFDPTWDAGRQDEFQYFMATPSSFIQTHIPFDPLWQLLERPVNHRGVFSRSKAAYHYKDSVDVFLRLDSLQQFLSIERRMKNAGANHEMFELWRSYNRMNIAIIAGEMDMNLYNGAVENLNEATRIFNAFISFRNQGFTPVKPDSELAAMLTPVGGLINEAYQKLDKTGLLVENFQYNTEGIRKKLNTLEKRCEEQKAFLKKYLASAPAQRAQMFYQ